MKKALMETSIPSTFTQRLMEKGLEWDPADTHICFGILHRAFADFLSKAKSKAGAVALKAVDLKGNMKLAGIVKYHPNEEEGMPGNWSYTITFDEEDIKDVSTVHDITDTQFQEIAVQNGARTFGVRFDNPISLHQTLELSIDVLKEYLDTNAKKGEVVEVEFEGYFLASVEVDKEEKVFSIVPDGAMKRLIKDDAAIEQN